ncbi:MAG: GntR family transcriptional regulator [Hyphomicrobiaceae bacterium]|nr:GntR family transcriptional regulator [Hyphomicrobiaceae bacterium]
MSGKLLNSEPLYVQLRTALARRIASGDWKPGETIPNELDLAKEYGLSAGTVRKALDWMEEAKLVSRQQGRGTFVTDPASKEAARRFNRLHDAQGGVLRLERVQMSLATADPTPEEQMRLGLAADQPVARVRLLDLHAGKPLMLEQIVVPIGLFPTLADTARRNETYDLLDLAHRNGVLLGKGEERITIGAPDAATATDLSVAAGTMLLVFDRIVRTIEDGPAEWRTAWCNPGGNHYLSDLS